MHKQRSISCSIEEIQEILDMPYDATSQLERLKELLLDTNDDWQPTAYVITEYFPYSDKDVQNGNKDIMEYSPNMYALRNIKIDIEDEMVFFDDLDGKLFKHEVNTALGCLAFCIDSVIFMAFQENNQITISFDDGYLRINY